MLYLFEELLVCSTDDNGVSVTHHGNQHVEQQDGDQDLEQNKHHLGHARVGALRQLLVLILAQCHVEQSYPGGHVGLIHARVRGALHDVEECLREPEQEDDVNDGECEHVSSDH